MPNTKNTTGRVTIRCSKCDGRGRIDWSSNDDGVCYSCNGAGSRTISAAENARNIDAAARILTVNAGMFHHLKRSLSQCTVAKMDRSAVNENCGVEDLRIDVQTLGGTDEAQMRKIFDGLAKGGKVRMPLEKQFWGDIFGNLTDKYGVEWMMNIGSIEK